MSYTFAKPDADRPAHWTHDDNMQSQVLGWIIANQEHNTISELFSIRPGKTPYEIFHNEIKPKAMESKIHMRAFTRLLALKMQHPDHEFLHEKKPVAEE